MCQRFCSAFPVPSGRLHSGGCFLAHSSANLVDVLIFDFSRCLNGMVNGNLGVIKSMIAELTDETNVARGFSLMPMARAVGYIIGLARSL